MSSRMTTDPVLPWDRVDPPDSDCGRELNLGPGELGSYSLLLALGSANVDGFSERLGVWR
jgi:hypothetical protein